jgi:hypothetical protein
MDAAVDATAAVEEDVLEGTPVQERTVQANHTEQGTLASTSEHQPAAGSSEQQRKSSKTEQQTPAAEQQVTSTSRQNGKS